MRKLLLPLLTVTSLCLTSPALVRADNKLTVHEWGTFTVLQAEDGKPIAGINTDEEPLPRFVHNLHNGMLVRQSDVPTVYDKGAPRVHPDIITRLETPVIYFYPPEGKGTSADPLTVDVDVKFKGGWLTEFYPDAKAGAPGLEENRFDFGRLREDTVGMLSWKGLKVGGKANGPETTSPVWLAPREVPKAASVRTAAWETERYLFYRGVGHIQTPVRVTRTNNDRLRVFGNWDGWRRTEQSDRGVAPGPMWLVDVRGDGQVAFTSIGSVDLPKDASATTPWADLPATFEERYYAPENFKALRKSMHAALVEDGLFSDEADALLSTWETSYFKRPGLRLFYLVPQQWTDKVMPLHVNSPDTPAGVAIDRVMVGRVEIVTRGQRQLLQQVGRGPVSDPQWILTAMKKLNAGRDDYYREEWYQQLRDGTRSLSTMNVEIPSDYRAYLGLGRFRNALVLDEQARRPSTSLREFINTYDLPAHEIREERAASE
jgi:hypothetical protein